VTLCRTAAPLLPFLTDEIHRGLCGGESVHLADWPDATALPADPELVHDMDRVREACSAALGLREAHRLRVRLPLASLTIAGPGSERLKPFFELVRDEVNVKALEVAEDLERFAVHELKVNARAVGPRVGKDMKAIMNAARAGEWKALDGGAVEVAGHRLEPDGDFTLALSPVEGLDGLAIEGLPSHDAVVALDVQTTPALEREGLARDAVRLLQQLRKDLDLEITTRVDVRYAAAGDQAEALTDFGDYIAEQVLAESVEATPAADLEGADWRTVDWPGADDARLAIRPRP